MRAADSVLVSAALGGLLYIPVLFFSPGALCTYQHLFLFHCGEYSCSISSCTCCPVPYPLLWSVDTVPCQDELHLAKQAHGRCSSWPSSSTRSLCSGSAPPRHEPFNGVLHWRTATARGRRLAHGDAARGKKSNRSTQEQRAMPGPTRARAEQNSPCMTSHAADPQTHAHVASHRHLPTPLRPRALPISRASTTSPGATRAHGRRGRAGGGGRHSDSRPCHRSRRPESRGHHSRPPWQPPTRWSSGDPGGQNPQGWPARAGRWASWGLHRQGANRVDQDRGNRRGAGKQKQPRHTNRQPQAPRC